MERVLITDRTLKELSGQKPLTFKEKIELVRTIDKLHVDCIELPAMNEGKADSLLVKSIGSAVRNAEIAVELRFTAESVHQTAAALSEATRGRLQICVPLSIVQMEYLYHMKPAAMQGKILEMIEEAKKTPYPVELIADDATRSDAAFLADTLHKAIRAGVDRISLRDSAGMMLPDEMQSFLLEIQNAVPELSSLPMGFSCSNAISMADACMVAALGCGVREAKLSCVPSDCPSMLHIVQLLKTKGEKLGVYCGVQTEVIRRVTEQIAHFTRHTTEGQLSGNSDEDSLEEKLLTAYDTQEVVLKAVRELGYELSSDDDSRIWAAFQNIIQKKQQISYRELDAIIAAEAMQVPSVWKVDSYLISTGNTISAMAHMKLDYRGEIREGIATGYGAIAAAFSAIEKAVGSRYELEDFQIQAITQGRESVGRTVVKLRSEGKLYSGQGISTDIVGAGIMAYINALNKIVYEEEEA